MNWQTRTTTPLSATTLAWLAMANLLMAQTPAGAAAKVPDRKLPQGVITGVQMLEFEFRQALGKDCAAERCFAKGCMPVAHTVVDRAASSSMPGLHWGTAPVDDTTSEQLFLTRVQCSFAHDASVRASDAKALSARLKTKLSRAWTEVEVVYEKLPKVRAALSEAPITPPPELEPDPTQPTAGAENNPEEGESPEPVNPSPLSEQWTQQVAGREFWLSILPHFFWMIGVVLLTVAGLVLIWAVRRLGKQSEEERLLLAQLSSDSEVEASRAERPAPPPSATPVAESSPAALERWRERLARVGKQPGAPPDPTLQALVRDWLRSGEHGLLAKALLLFPDELPRAFPQDSDLAPARVALADYLKHYDSKTLPSDDEFVDMLDRYAVSAELTAGVDTDLLRGLHDDFGPSALAEALGTLPARYGALLLAHSSEAMQHEAARLVSQEQALAVVYWLMRSNRVDPSETSYLLAALGALREGSPLPPAPDVVEVSDRGREFSAAQALSILLPRLDAKQRSEAIHSITSRLNGTLPGWLRETLYAEMLQKLDSSTVTELLLEVDATQLAAWLQTQSAQARSALLQVAPPSLQQAIAAVSLPRTPSAFYALARAGRMALSAGLQRQLAPDYAFEALLT